MDGIDKVQDLFAALPKLFLFGAIAIGDHVSAHGDSDLAVKAFCYFFHFVSIGCEDDVEHFITLFLTDC
jgi:hypothetical protein